MELFELAMAQPEPERDAYLRAACAGDNELLECVLGYVRNQKRLRGFLDRCFHRPRRKSRLWKTN
jgi:hypothetical protein